MSLFNKGLYNSLVRIIHPSHKHYFNSCDFPSLKIFEDNYDIIKKEALNVYYKKKLLNMKDIGNMAFDSIDDVPNKWKVYIIKWYDKINDNAYINCPEICKIIEKLNNVHIAMISILEPGKFIRPHKGPSTGCLRYHFGLQIPKDKKNYIQF